MAAKELGERVHHDIRAKFDRLEQNRRRHGVVDDQRHAGAMRDFGDGFDVADLAGGIADGFAEHRTGVLIDQPGDVVWLVAGRETAGDALPRQDVGQQRMRGAVELRHRNDVAAVIGEIDEGEMQRGLTARHCQRTDATFQLSHTLFQHAGGRIGDPRVAIAFGLEIEQRGAVVGAVERIGCGLIDRHRNGVSGGFGLVAGVDSERLVAHELLPSPRLHFTHRGPRLAFARTHRISGQHISKTTTNYP